MKRHIKQEEKVGGRKEIVQRQRKLKTNIEESTHEIQIHTVTRVLELSKEVYLKVSK